METLQIFEKLWNGNILGREEPIYNISIAVIKTWRHSKDSLHNNLLTRLIEKWTHQLEDEFLSYYNSVKDRPDQPAIEFQRFIFFTNRRKEYSDHKILKTICKKLKSKALKVKSKE